MSLAPCQSAVDSNGKELKEHGTTPLPVACYYDDLREEEVPWHWHEELEAAVVTEGCAVVAAGNEKFTIQQGEGFFINSGILHGCWDVDTSACRLHSVVFHPRLVGGSLDSVFYQSYVQPLVESHVLEALHLKPSVPWQEKALNEIETAWQACRLELSGYEFQMRSALSELILCLREHLPAEPAAPNVKALQNAERIKTMLQYIHDNHAEELNVAQIARSAALSESECMRCFRMTIDTTPMKYVREYRIQQAANAIATTDDRVSDIAYQCGFQDLSYFTKTFRQQKGCSPKAYRQKMREAQ